MNMLRTIIHYCIPHQSNNQRAKILHIDALFGYVLVLLVFNFGIRILHRSMPSDILGYATDIHVEQLLAGTNKERASKGLAPLQLNSVLSQAAAAKAQDMFTYGYWSHNSPTGKTPWDFIVTSGYRYTIAGENLAKNFSTSQSVVDAWMASPTHRDNIVKDGYRDIGFAVVNGVLNGEETTLVVQMFGAGSSPVQAFVPPVQAAGTEEVPAPVELPEEPAAQSMPEESAAPLAQETGKTWVLPALSSFSSVYRKPLIDIPSVSRDVVFIFSGVLVGALMVDLIIVRRRRLVRLTGHTIGHILFLVVMMVIISRIQFGSLV